MDDTPPAMFKKMHELLKSVPPIERLKMGSSMYDTSRLLIIRSIKEKNPDVSEADLRKEIFLKFYKSDFNEFQIEQILKYLDSKGFTASTGNSFG